MINFGRVRPGSTLEIYFESFASSTGAPITITGLATSDILVYKDGGTTQRASASGFTLLDTDGIDFDGITGIHGFSIDLSDNTTADFWAAGSRYTVVVSTITVDSQTMSFIAATFRIGYEAAILDTTIATLSSQTSFTLASGPAEDDALNGRQVVIHDAASAVQIATGLILDYTGSTKTVTLAAAPTFTIAAKDNISVMALAPLQPATLGKALVVDSAGLADANMVKAGPSGSGTAQTAGDLAALVTAVDDYVDTEVAAILAAVDTEVAAIKAKTDNLPAVPAATGDCITAAGVRTAVGLASANLDTQLSSLSSKVDAVDDYVDTEVAAILAAVDTEVAAIKAKTDNLPAAPAATGDCITAAGVRTAVGLASADLDTQLSSLSSKVDAVDDYVDTEVAAILAAVDTEVAAIKAKTDNLPAAPAATGDAMTLTTGERTSIATAIFKLDLSTITGEASRSLLNAVRFLRNKWSIATGTLTVTKEDDTTAAWTATVSTDAAADPVIGSDPS